MTRNRAGLLPILLAALGAPLAGATTTVNQPFTATDLIALRRVSDPQVAPGGKAVAFVVREPSVDGEDATQVWWVDLREPPSAARAVTQHAASSWGPRWAPDGRTLYFLSSRSGTAQVWRLPLQGGGEASRVTDYPVDISTFQIAPDGNRIAVTMSSRPDCAQPACVQQSRPGSTARLYDRLFVRHWDRWDDGSRSALFVAPIDAQGHAGPPVNVSGGVQAHVPSRPGGGSEEYAFSPDGTRIVFSARIMDAGEAWSTNFDLYDVDVDGRSVPRNLTAANPAWDTQPIFLPNGDLAYIATSRPGVESDTFTIRIRDVRSGVTRVLAADWDRSVRRLGLSRDGRLLATADDQGQSALFSIDIDSGRVVPMVREGQVSEFSSAGGTIVVAWASLASPPDLYIARSGAAPKKITRLNDAVLATRTLSPYEPFAFAGWNDERVLGYVMKPVDYRPGSRYPVAFLVHGGPESTFLNRWDWRWNAQTFAGHGYAVVMIDFHGSSGYGRAFTDSIAQDWGGKPLVDLQKGLAAALDRFEWLNRERMCSLGPSYGGYMQNWIASEWPGPFKCLVNHAGIFDTRSMYYTTDELWFMDWENGGPYYARAPSLENFNPAVRVDRWHTPMLVIHGGRDYRVPDSQGLATFTALQRRGVRSRFLYFPDENHWIRRPANVVLWYESVLQWLDEHLR